MNQHIAPFFDAVRAYAAGGIIPFHTPGHKQGRGAPAEWRDVVGLGGLQMDVSDVVVSEAHNDSWFEALAAAEAMAAPVLGADTVRFLANGTTGGIHALLLAAGLRFADVTERPIIVARNSHRSVLGGLMLADALPVYVSSPFDARRRMWMPPEPDAWEKALADNPNAAALLVTYPTYEGVTPDLEAIANIADTYDVPLLVDEAHGPHFGLHPRLPRRALDLGAEWSAQSPHKLLGSLTQSSWLLGRPRRISVDGVDAALGVLQTTSPNALIFASLDVARRQVALEGRAMMNRALAVADEVRAFVEDLPGLANVTFESPFWDETKLLIDVSGVGMNGFAAARRLRQGGVQVEMGTARHVLALATFGDTKETVAALCQTLASLVEEKPGPEEGLLLEETSLPGIPPQLMRPRQAALGPSRWVPLAAAAGEIASEIVCPYPPGIPVLCPGEQVSDEAVSYLQDILHSGGEVRGVSGPSDNATVRVVAT